MKRLDSLAAAAACIEAALFVPAPPASAATVCAGQGSAAVGTGLGLPPSVAHTTFSLHLSFGSCSGLDASGSLWGACGNWSGTGWTNTGHSFTFQGLGTAMILQGSATGTVNTTEDPADSGSCINGEATVFIITVAIVLS